VRLPERGFSNHFTRTTVDNQPLTLITNHNEKGKKLQILHKT